MYEVNTIRLGFLILVLWLTGCATNIQHASITEIDRSNQKQNILLMPLDVELSILTAGGVFEPNSKWTESAKSHLSREIREHLSLNGLELTAFERPEQTDLLYHDLIELEQLHALVGQTVITHTSVIPLPSKKDVFDWTIGDSAKHFKEKNIDAGYALFVHIRDSYKSTGRVFIEVGAALLGYSLPEFPQVGFASLVDLDTGDIVWFNYLVNPAGDLRTEQPAKETVAYLLKNFPV